jgi:hypothetical protein
MTRQNVVEIILTARTWIKKSGWKTQLYTGVETQGSDCSTESKERLLREGLQVFHDKEKAFEFVDSGLKGRNINCVQFFDGACNSLIL